MDVIAVGILLFGAAVYSSARNAMHFATFPNNRIIINNHFRAPRVPVRPVPPLPLVRE